LRNRPAARYINRLRPRRRRYHTGEESGSRQRIGLDQRNQNDGAEHGGLARKRNGHRPGPLQQPGTIDRRLFKHGGYLPWIKFLDIRPVLFYLDTLAGCFVPRKRRSRLARRGSDHDGIDLAEYDVDAAGHSRHDGACRNRDKSSHQRVFDQILTPAITPNLPTEDGPNYLQHCLISYGSKSMVESITLLK
jgi:hypothetical protein